jgi:ankyrin repeat protein
MVADGHKINARDRDGRTALHHAYEALRLDAAELLVELGAKASLRDHRNFTASAILTRARIRYVHALADCAQDRRLVDADVEPFGIDQADTNGNTALHLAYYRSHTQAVGQLIELGADQEAVNHRDLMPREYGEVGASVSRLIALAGLFSPSRARWTGSAWTDGPKARGLYDTLSGQDPTIFANAVEIAVIWGEQRREVAQVVIKLGIAESDVALIYAFGSNPSKGLAEDYLNSGSQPLYSTARNWAAINGFRIVESPYGAAARWGVF